MAALSAKALRRRLRTVKSTQKITRAMETVSSVKLRRAQERLVAARPHALRLADVVRSLAQDEEARAHPLCDHREIKRRTLVLVTADRGLCGAFNANVLKQADKFLSDNADKPIEIIAIGKRAADYARRRQVEVIDREVPLGGVAKSDVASRLGQVILERFLTAQTDEVTVLYTHMKSLIQFVPTLEKLLPLEMEQPEEGDAPATRAQYIFEPSAQSVLAAVLPRSVESRLYLTMAESCASEHSARRVAMHNATENCKELGQRLTLDINKARQGAITKELLEIVAGAEALTG
jgi:F-type H+-transporting ATPase subunit gamma